MGNSGAWLNAEATGLGLLKKEKMHKQREDSGTGAEGTPQQVWGSGLWRGREKKRKGRREQEAFNRRGRKSATSVF